MSACSPSNISRCADGPVVNEIAPRVHNSGHWTIEGAVTSQFEQHIRAVCGLPLGSTERIARGVTMDNLIGDEANGWPALVAEPGAHLHLYGKGEAAPRPQDGACHPAERLGARPRPIADAAGLADTPVNEGGSAMLIALLVPLALAILLFSATLMRAAIAARATPSGSRPSSSAPSSASSTRSASARSRRPPRGSGSAAWSPTG